MSIEQRMVELTIKHSRAEGCAKERADVLTFLQGNLAGVQLQRQGDCEGEPRQTFDYGDLNLPALEYLLEHLIEQFGSGKHIP